MQHEGPEARLRCSAFAELCQACDSRQGSASRRLGCSFPRLKKVEKVATREPVTLMRSLAGRPYVTVRSSMLNSWRKGGENISFLCKPFVCHFNGELQRSLVKNAISLHYESIKSFTCVALRALTGLLCVRNTSVPSGLARASVWSDTSLICM